MPTVRHPIENPPVACHSVASVYDALAPATDRGRVTFLASSEGEADYRYTEQVRMMQKGSAGLKDGKDQIVTFAPVGNLKLKVTSDAGLPVGYYVAVGPAVIDDGTLRVAELPAHVAFSVQVVAYQFDRGVESLSLTESHARDAPNGSSFAHSVCGRVV